MAENPENLTLNIGAAEGVLRQYQQQEFESLTQAERLLTRFREQGYGDALRRLQQQNLGKAVSVLKLFTEKRLHHFNIFLKLGFFVDEVKLSSAVASLLDPRESHRLGTRPLKSLLNGLKARSPVEIPPILQLVDQHADRIYVVTERKRENTIPDIEVVGPEFIIFIENKIRGGKETEHLDGPQTVRQRIELDKLSKTQGLHTLGIFLTPEGKIPMSCGFISLSVAELVGFIRDALKDYDECKQSIEVFLDYYDWAT